MHRSIQPSSGPRIGEVAKSIAQQIQAVPAFPSIGPAAGLL
jgi:hypothetical protein